MSVKVKVKPEAIQKIIVSNLKSAAEIILNEEANDLDAWELITDSLELIYCIRF